MRQAARCMRCNLYNVTVCVGVHALPANLPPPSFFCLVPHSEQLSGTLDRVWLFGATLCCFAGHRCVGLSFGFPCAAAGLSAPQLCPPLLACLWWLTHAAAPRHEAVIPSPHTPPLSGSQDCDCVMGTCAGVVLGTCASAVKMRREPATHCWGSSVVLLRLQQGHPVAGRKCCAARAAALHGWREAHHLASAVTAVVSLMHRKPRLYH